MASRYWMETMKATRVILKHPRWELLLGATKLFYVF
jgi:hypothetical protein